MCSTFNYGTIIGHFHMTSADPAGGNNKPVGIVQPGNRLMVHKHKPL